MSDLPPTASDEEWYVVTRGTYFQPRDQYGDSMPFVEIEKVKRGAAPLRPARRGPFKTEAEAEIQRVEVEKQIRAEYIR